MIRLLLPFLCASALAATTATVGTLNVGSSIGGGGGGWAPPSPPADTETVHYWNVGANAFQIDFVPITVTNNAPFTNKYGITCGDPGYLFSIAKYEISEDQWHKARLAGGIDIGGSLLGTNKPVTKMTQWQMAEFVNWLNVNKGYRPAYSNNSLGYPQLQTGTNIWVRNGRTNLYRDSRARHFLPSHDEANLAAFYDPNTATWFNYAHGSNTPPIEVDGFFLNGSTNTGTAVYNRRMFPYYPEHDSAGNVVEVNIMQSGGVVDSVAFASYTSGLVFQTTNLATPNITPLTEFLIVQGSRTNATVRIASWQSITWVPGTFTNYVRGSGYSDGTATVTLDGYTVNVDLVTRDGEVYGAIPTGGRFNSEDYTTELDIVQAGGSGAKCKVSRYSYRTYAGPKVPATFTIISGGSGYSDGTATVTTHKTSWYPDLDPRNGVSFYKFCEGAADVDRAGGPSPFGVYGLAGNVTDCFETQDFNIVDDRYVNDDFTSYHKYGGGWWFRKADVLEHFGSDSWRAWDPTDTFGGAYGNGVRIVYVPPQ